MEFFYHGHLRMDWGLGNPNKTAVLIACLLVVVWGFTRWRRTGFWLALALFTGLGICLVQTYSRGGLVAALAGQAVWWTLEGRKHLGPALWKGGALALSLLGLFLYAQSGPVEAADRWTEGIRPGSEPDRSVTNRLTMWRWAPRMIVDAPGGWGHGQSGQAYMQWYQPTGTRYFYRTLVNSHLTRLVEWNLAGRLAYLWGWLAVLWVTWPGWSAPRSAVPLGCWVAFGTGGVFSTVDETRVLWILPVASLGWALVERFRHRDWARWPLAAAGPLAGATALFALLWIAGKQTPTAIPIRHQNGVTSVGRADAFPLAVTGLDREILGTHYGIILRSALENGDSTSRWHWASSPAALAASGIEPEALIHPGEVPPLGLDFPSPPRNLVLNPRSAAGLEPLKNARQALPPLVIVGGVREDALARLLRNRGDDLGWKVVESRGNQWFLPAWPHEVELHIQSNQNP